MGAEVGRPALFASRIEEVRVGLHTRDEVL